MDIDLKCVDVILLKHVISSVYEDCDVYGFCNIVPGFNWFPTDTFLTFCGVSCCFIIKINFLNN